MSDRDYVFIANLETSQKFSQRSRLRSEVGDLLK